MQGKSSKQGLLFIMITVAAFDAPVVRTLHVFTYMWLDYMLLNPINACNVLRNLTLIIY